LNRLPARFFPTLCGVCLLLLGSTQTLAADEQIVIEDLTPAQLRAEIKKIETEYYRVFNASIEDKKLAIICYDTVPTGSHRKIETCEPQFAIDKRAENANDSRFGNNILYSQQSMNRDLALEYEALTAALTSLAAQSEYFRELDGILGALRDELNNR